MNGPPSASALSPDRLTTLARLDSSARPLPARYSLKTLLNVTSPAKNRAPSADENNGKNRMNNGAASVWLSFRPTLLE